MNPDNERKLAGRVAAAGEAALAARGYVTAIDILVGVGWLASTQIERWRRGQLPYLERGVTANLSKIGTALRLLRRWAEGRGLRPSRTVYLAATRERRPLRFSKTGEHAVERAYHTHWVSPARSRRQPGIGAARSSHAPTIQASTPEGPQSRSPFQHGPGGGGPAPVDEAIMTPTVRTSGCHKSSYQRRCPIPSPGPTELRGTQGETERVLAHHELAALDASYGPVAPGSVQALATDPTFGSDQRRQLAEVLADLGPQHRDDVLRVLGALVVGTTGTPADRLDAAEALSARLGHAGRVKIPRPRWKSS